MKTKFKVKTVALISALVMLLSAFCSFGIVSARASDVSDEENANYVFPDPTPDALLNPDPYYTSFYYFSNYSGSVDYYNSGFIGQYIAQNPYLESSEMYYWDYSNTSYGFWTEMGLYYATSDISNALIVFEVRGDLPFKLGIYDGTEDPSEIEERYENSVYSFMKTMFSDWKESNCKIAFICDTDEVWFENNYDEFLDYVDIHINLDVLTSFVYSTAVEIIDRGYENSTVILDNTMSQDWFFKDLFAPYLAFVANEEIGGIYPVNYILPENILSTLHITAYFYTEYGDYTDIFGNPVSSEEVVDHCKGNLYIVGDISSQNDLGLKELRKESSASVFFAYNTYQLSVAVNSDVLKAGPSKDTIDYHLSVILRDFILNNDYSLLKYNNWSGRCMISFKLIYGTGGWLRKSKAYTVPPDPVDAI